MSQPDPRSIPPASSLATRWASRRTFGPAEPGDASVLAEAKRAQGLTISVAVVGTTDQRLAAVRDAIAARLARDVGLVDEVVALRTRPVQGGRARGSGASSVVDPARVIPEVPWVGGRGDALWRTLTMLRGDIVVWVDGEDRRFGTNTVIRLVAPLLADTSIAFVKGFNPSVGEIEVEIDDVVYLAGGARLTDLLVRPLLSIFFPELAAFLQPHAGQCAGRSGPLRRIPFLSGCSVDIAMLIDLFELVGLDGLAQVDLGAIAPNARPVDELGPEAHAIARTVLKRAQEMHRLELAPSALAHPLLARAGNGVVPVRIDEIERPPIDVLPPYLAALRSIYPNGNGSRYAAAREG